MEALTRAFFPANEPLPLVVQVCYYVFPNEVTPPEGQAECKNFTYQFRWTKSQVHFFITPDLLQSLSLYVIQIRKTAVSLALDPFCDENQNIADDSSQNALYRKPEELLKQLTTSVSSTVYKPFHSHVFIYVLVPLSCAWR